MLSELISHSPALKKLWDEGHSIETIKGFLLVHDVPYVNSQKRIKRGTLVTSLMMPQPDKTSAPDTHVIHFIGNIHAILMVVPSNNCFMKQRDKELITDVLKVNF